jgi:exodeoxyribonuclease VII large subunit
MTTADNEKLTFGVSQFVSIINQSLDYAFREVYIIGELANLKISNNRWVYFDLKDEGSVVRFFGSVYTLPGPLEDGMVIKVQGFPRLHNKYGFSVNVKSISLAGEGSIERAAELLKAKLQKEGLFDLSRKTPA